MSIKEQIIQKINSIEDPAILREILQLINIESEIDQVYILSDAERRNINEGLSNADTGKVYSQKESDKLISKWLEDKSSGL